MKARWLPLSLLAFAAPNIAFAQTTDAGVAPTATTETPPPPPPPPPPPFTPPPPVHVEPAPAATSASEASPFVQITSLKLLLDKNLITRDEYESAMRDVASSAGNKALTDTNTLVLGRFAMTIYGFVEADAIHDSTIGQNDLQGNALVARNEAFNGQRGQLLGTIRNSRFGFRIKAPEFHGIKVSGMMEMDFIGSPAAIGYPAAAGQASEAATFSNAVVRERHINVKVETPIVDLLFGQWWALFGWQPYFHINTVDFQGVPTEIYSRRPQFRVSKTLKTDPINVDLAVAALDPVQKMSEAPEMQAGARLVINKWKGKITHGATGTQVEPASIGVSGDMKYVKLPTPFSDKPTGTTDLVGTAIAVSAFLPVIPTKDNGKSGNNLSITGEFATGYGVADQYTGLTGGVTFPALPNPTGATPAPVYPQNIDNGVAILDTTTNTPHFLQWYTTLVGVQYYFPIKDGKIWVTANYGHEESPNTTQFGQTASKVRSSLDWFNADLFAEPVPGFRMGLSYGRTWDNYGDKQQAVNDRVMGSAFFIF